VGEVVADRLRHLAPARLEPVAGDVRALVDELAALAVRAEGRDPRPLPPVSPRAFGDQVAVLTHDLLEACRAGGDDEALRQAYSVLVALRRRLP